MYKQGEHYMVESNVAGWLALGSASGECLVSPIHDDLYGRMAVWGDDWYHAEGRPGLEPVRLPSRPEYRQYLLRALGSCVGYYSRQAERYLPDSPRGLEWHRRHEIAQRALELLKRDMINK